MGTDEMTLKGIINVNEQQNDSEKPPMGIWTQ